VINIYRTIILPADLYGCETWSQTLREERRLRVFENRVLRIVFGPKRDEMTGEWTKLHNEELNDLYSLPNIVRVVKSSRMRWAGHVACMGEGRGVQRVLVGKPEGKRPLGRPRCRWEDNIKMDLQEVGGGREDWMELAQDRDKRHSAYIKIKKSSEADIFYPSVMFVGGGHWPPCRIYLSAASIVLLIIHYIANRILL
jgi:hypothetical protein